jgi:hypothetical protein
VFKEYTLLFYYENMLLNHQKQEVHTYCVVRIIFLLWEIWLVTMLLYPILMPSSLSLVSATLTVNDRLGIVHFQDTKKRMTIKSKAVFGWSLLVRTFKNNKTKGLND